jgi:shikimate kinase
MKNNIVLCGFMGCGKTTVGKILAEKLGYTFKDSDLEIEKEQGTTISEIFNKFGEAYFRSLETEMLKRLSDEKGLIIATGGGAVVNKNNADILKENNFVVYLKVTPETVLERLKNDTTRPLLMRDDKETAIKTLMAEREDAYNYACHLCVDANVSAKKCAETIFYKYSQNLDTSNSLM